MKTEEQIADLLKLRFKVIADYPQSGFKVGDIWPNCAPDWTTDEQKDFTLSEMAKYPHLFQPLPWNAERKPEEMPEYLLNIADRKVFKIIRFDLQSAFVKSIEGEKFWHHLLDAEPATEQQYNQYIKSKK